VIKSSHPVEIIERLKEIVGVRNYIEDTSNMDSYVNDARGLFHGLSPLILKPLNSEMVSAIVTLCNEACIGIVPQGGNTGLVGGSVPSKSGLEVVISLERMNKIIDIDPINYTMTLEAGCILSEVQNAARDIDRMFPLSLAAEGSCQIGGNLSTNAGGTAVLRYGNAKELVLGLEVVLPDGTIMSGLRRLRKDNTGYDLKQLFIGAEGTLGVITKVSLKLASKPKNTVTCMVAVKSVNDAIDLLRNTKITFGDNVTAFEFMSDTCIQAIEKYLNHMKLPLGSTHSWQIIFEIINQKEQDIINFLENHMESGQIIDGLIANSEKEKNEIWLVRHSISEAEKLSGNGIHHDISIPIKRIPEFLKIVKPAMEKIVGSSVVYTFGHLGDGNLHLTKKQPGTISASDFLDKTHEINRKVHGTAETLGGSFSAEHGIGSKLMDDLVHFSDPIKIQLMQTIKKSLDPKNIMNPNKLIKI